MNKVNILIAAATGALAAGLLVVSLSAPSQARQYEDRTPSDRIAPRCLDGQRVGRIHVVNEDTLLVYDTSMNAYKLSIGGPCRTMTDMSHIGFEFNGGSQICHAHDAFILHSEMDEAPVRCIINGVTPLTRDEAAALDER